MQERRAGNDPGREPQAYLREGETNREQRFSLELGIGDLQLLLEAVAQEKRQLQKDLSSIDADQPTAALDADNIGARLTQCDAVIGKLSAALQ